MQHIVSMLMNVCSPSYTDERRGIKDIAVDSETACCDLLIIVMIKLNRLCAVYS